MSSLASFLVLSAGGQSQDGRGPGPVPSRLPSPAPAPQKEEEGREEGEEPRVRPTGLADVPAGAVFSGWVGGSGLRTCWGKFGQSLERPSEGQGPHMVLLSGTGVESGQGAAEEGAGGCGSPETGRERGGGGCGEERGRGRRREGDQGGRGGRRGGRAGGEKEEGQEGGGAGSRGRREEAGPQGVRMADGSHALIWASGFGMRPEGQPGRGRRSLTPDPPCAPGPERFISGVSRAYQQPAAHSATPYVQAPCFSRRRCPRDVALSLHLRGSSRWARVSRRSPSPSHVRSHLIPTRGHGDNPV